MWGFNPGGQQEISGNIYTGKIEKLVAWPEKCVSVFLVAYVVAIACISSQHPRKRGQKLMETKPSLY